MKNLLKLFTCIIGCELVGIFGAFFTTQAIPVWYSTLHKPFFAPPNWLFGPVWTILYFLMGTSLYLLLRKQSSQKKKATTALRVFLIQISLNFIWSPIFFGLRSPILGFVVIVGLLYSIALTMRHFHPLSKPAFYLLAPYLAWVSFATILNLSIIILN